MELLQVKNLSFKYPNTEKNALENINFGAHPLFTILNMGLLENFEGGYNFYRDCCSPSIAKVEDALDRERLTVGESMLFMQVIALLFMNLTEAKVHMEKSKMLLLIQKIVILQKIFHIYLFLSVNWLKSAVFKFQLLKH